MSFTKNYLVVVLISSTLFTGCVKFEDPQAGEAPEPINYSSPCTETLADNMAEALTPLGSIVASYNFSPFCNDLTNIDGNPSTGSFEIILSEPVVESRSFSLSFPFVQENQAQLRLRLNDLFTAPTYYSTSGELYVEVQSDGSKVYEWCEVPTQTTGSSSSSYRTSGRLTCN